MLIAFIIRCILFMAIGLIISDVRVWVSTGFVGSLLRLYKYIQIWDVEVAVSALPTESLQVAKVMAGAAPAGATGLMYSTGLRKFR